MDSNDSQSILHKKARVAREGFDARAMSPAKALRVSLAKTADMTLGLALSVSTLEQTVVSTEGLLGKLDEQGLLILLDGTLGARGLAAFDCQVVSAIIEKQISGLVSTTEAQPRGYTRTDAAMVAPLLDATLAGFDAELSAHHEGHRDRDFRFGDKVEDVRAMSLLLEGGKFDLFRLTVDLEEGAKTGVIMLALPCLLPVQNHVDVSKSGRPITPPNLGKHALDATVTLTTVVARIKMPLHNICALEPGMILPFSANSFAESQLVAQPRHVVAEVRLGQLDGMRAVRIMMPGSVPIGHAEQAHSDVGASEIGAGHLDAADLEMSTTPIYEVANGDEMTDALADTEAPANPAEFDLGVPDPLPALAMSDED